MTTFVKATALAAVAAVGLAGAASAATLAGAASAATFSVLDWSKQGDENKAGIDFAVGYGAHTPVGATWDKPNVVIDVPPGNNPGNFQSPFNSNGLTDTVDYFSTQPKGGPGLGAASPVTLGFTEVQQAFTMLWGSIDKYNSVTFKLDGSDVYTVGGDDVAGAIGLDPATNYEVVALVKFLDFESGFDSITFASKGPALEFALAPIPLPAAGWLLLAGLGGLGVVARRKKA